MKPHRIQIKKTKGWKLPEDAVFVGEGTKWKNPHSFVGELDIPTGEIILPPDAREALQHVVDLYEYVVEDKHEEIKSELKGKNIACSCPLDLPCHGDVLLKIANS